MTRNSKEFSRKRKQATKKNSIQKNKPVLSAKGTHATEDSAESIDFVYGVHPVEESLKANRGNKLFLFEQGKGNKVKQLKELAREKAVPIQWVPKEKLDTLSQNGAHQGAVLGVTPFDYVEFDELLDQVFSKKTAPFLLLLDSLEDPHNFGSILRTSDAAGVDAIIIPKHRAVGVTSIVAKTSTGAVEHVPISRVTNLSQTIQELKEKGFWIFGTDVEGTDYRQWKAEGPIVLIIGNEGKGMSSLLKKQVDEMLTIPMIGHVQSLNASVATGLLIYEAFRQRNPV